MKTAVILAAAAVVLALLHWVFLAQAVGIVASIAYASQD